MSCLATASARAEVSFTSRLMAVVLVKLPASFWAEANVRQATVTCTPALERTSTVGVATKPEPRRRADCGIVVVVVFLKYARGVFGGAV